MASRGSEQLRKKRSRLIPEDYEKIVTYIEDPENFAALQGARSKRGIGHGEWLTKAAAFSIMAAQFSGKNGFPEVTGNEMQKRFERYVVMYKKAREWEHSTAGGLSEAELKAGMTIEEELNRKCAHYRRMDAAFGSGANNGPRASHVIGSDSQSPPDNVPAERTQLQVGARAQTGARESEEEDERDFTSSAFADATERGTENPYGPARPKEEGEGVTNADANGEGERTQGSAGRGAGAKSAKMLLISLYQEALRDKAECRRLMLRHRLASLEGKKRARERQERENERKRLEEMQEVKRLKMNLYVELIKPGKTVSEMNAIIAMIKSFQ